MKNQGQHETERYALIDAAKLLETASRKIKKLAEARFIYNDDVVNVKATINAALIRLPIESEGE